MRTLITESRHEGLPDQVFVVLTAAVLIGAPWITPLRATAWGILRGGLPQVVQGLITLFVGALFTASLSFLLGKLVGLPDIGKEVLSRTTPNLLDLGIALVAGLLYRR